MGSFPNPYLWFPKGDLDILGDFYADPSVFLFPSCILPLRRPKVQIWNWPIPLNLEESARI